MKTKLCFSADAMSLPIVEGKPTASRWLIQLSQTGIDRFEVRYGAQANTSLSYGQAATKLGQALMHALACEGKLDNRERDER